MTDDANEDAATPLATEMSRRTALDAAITGGGVLLGGATLYPIVRFVGAQAPADTATGEVSAGKGSAVAAGTALAFRFGSKPALLVRDHGGKLRAFIAICSHLDCVVQFRPAVADIWCACHNGHFDLAGHNVRGPPPRPLTELAVEFRGDDVFVRRA